MVSENLNSAFIGSVVGIAEKLDPIFRRLHRIKAITMRIISECQGNIILFDFFSNSIFLLINEFKSNILAFYIMWYYKNKSETQEITYRILRLFRS